MVRGDCGKMSDRAEPLSLVGEKCRFPLVHAVVGLVAASCVRAAHVGLAQDFD